MKAKERMILKTGPSGVPGTHPPVTRIGIYLAFLLLTPMAWGCDDNPFQIRWELNPDTVQIYSLARPEMNLASGFDFLGRSKVRVESPSSVGGWDVAVDTQDGAIVLLPPGAIGVPNSTARIAPMGTLGFDDIRRAPRDTTLYIGDRPIPVEVGELYVVRTRQQRGSFGSNCVYYGKIKPIVADPDEGFLRFVFDISPVCNDRKLIPPKD